MVKISVASGDITEAAVDAIAVNLFKGVKRPGGATGAADKALGGVISELVKLQDFSGKEGEVVVVPAQGAVKAKRVIVVGLGDKDAFGLDQVRIAAAVAARTAEERGCKSLATVLHGGGIGGLDAEDAGQALAEGVLMGLYKFKEFQSQSSEDDPPVQLARCRVVEADSGKVPSIRKGVKRGTILAEATNLARTLINRPSNVKPPAQMAKIARQEAGKHGIKTTVLTPAQMEKLGMGLILGVGSGSGLSSPRGPRMVILEYNPQGKKTVALVGKGITFDTGGINIKPSKGMEQMKYDMAGSATVLAAIIAAARMKVKHRVVAYMALAENMPSGTAIRPGDILEAYDGTQVEIGNTDAEGRLVLGDALAHCIKHQKPDVVLDVATLTGAVKVALGDITTGVMANDDGLVKDLTEIGEPLGEALWQLPLHKTYEDMIKTPIADIKNTGPGWGGTIMGAAFLKHFVGDKAKWAHLDIAGTCWTDMGPSELKKAYLPKGATGVAVRLFAEYLRRKD